METALVSMIDAPSETDGGRTVHLRIPAKAEYITLCRLALTGLGRLRPIADDTLADLKLALTEAVSNSVRHAYGASGDGCVDVRYELHPDRLHIEVVDDGAGFDPRAPAAPNGEELSEGGLGIAIIRSIADEFELRSQAGERGSTLRFAKNLDG
ncbi:MAG TPA: ATP-binding protein [Gaiellaceae bacterium]|nr:ATP-binding protein [Gaiellaceae bacterium]